MDLQRIPMQGSMLLSEVSWVIFIITVKPYKLPKKLLFSEKVLVFNMKLKLISEISFV